MILTLEVTGPREATPGAENRKVFHASGGTIGRQPDNDWVLPDPYISSRHARIRYANGVFHIEDTSTNGVFINSPDNRLVRGQQYALKSGDRILIDPYEIHASITAEAEQPGGDSFGLDDPFGAPSTPQWSPSPPRSSPKDAALDRLSSAGEVDPLRALGFGEDRAPAPDVPRAADLAGRSLLSEHYQAPPLPAAPTPPPSPPGEGGSFIPEDYDPLRPDSRPSVEAAPAAPPGSGPAAPPMPRPPSRGQSAMGAGAVAPEQARAAAGGGGPADVGLAAVLAGAGIDSVVVTPEFARDFGRILRVVVSGVMDVLQARQRIKDEFRMRMTTFKPSQNNPLKFSANVDDALHNLLVKRNPAYLGSVEAFEDAFDDVRNHQMAMLAGVRVAFEAMLAELNPDRLQEEFDRRGKGSLRAVPAKLRYWDQYRDKFNDMVSDADATFRELFGQEFARAYEEQLERLKAHDRARTP